MDNQTLRPYQNCAADYFLDTTRRFEQLIAIRRQARHVNDDDATLVTIHVAKR